MREPLRKKLELAAKARKASLNNEVVARLEKSFVEEDAFGGPDAKRMVHLIAASFVNGGAVAAHAMGMSEWKNDEWMSDQYCYSRAVHAAVRELLLSQQDTTLDDLLLQIEAIKSSVATTLLAKEQNDAR
jgi:hypothetical protein